jgi:hypothetical protein
MPEVIDDWPMLEPGCPAVAEVPWLEVELVPNWPELWREVEPMDELPGVWLRPESEEFPPELRSLERVVDPGVGIEPGVEDEPGEVELWAYTAPESIKVAVSTAILIILVSI